VEELKRKAAAQALEEVRSGMILGLGTGSTVAHFLDLLGRRLADGELTDIVGVPTSLRTEEAAGRAGIRLGTLTRYPELDLAVDGADEVSPTLDLIKGMGGALLREKMVAQASRRFVVIADSGKAVARLGTVSPLPVEVVPWEWECHLPFLRGQGCSPVLRSAPDGAPYRTDNGNFVLDCRFPEGIADVEALQGLLESRAGVVETGCFLGMADAAVLAASDGITVLGRPA